MLMLAQKRLLFTQRFFRHHDEVPRRAFAPEAMSQGHVPVLLEETLDLLLSGVGPQGRVRVLDCTFGGGGHSRCILERFPNCDLTAIDTDPEAAVRAKELTAFFPGRFHFVDSNFSKLDTLDLGGAFDAILFDLGVSSFHFDTPGRGFSFRFDAPLDMRMNPREGMGAAGFLESAPASDLVRAVRDYGEEPHWRRIVQAIQNARGSGVLSRTASFAALVESVAGRQRPGHIHPATRVFQGVRIMVNGEMDSLELALPAAFAKLAPGCRLAVISFHSIEDRIVKRYFRRVSGRPESREDNTAQQDRDKRAELITSRPVQATPAEEEANPRSRSAKLRVLQKL
jgi:16S rRNA (cytosine1402-N4)-methyltransferase